MCSAKSRWHTWHNKVKDFLFPILAFSMPSQDKADYTNLFLVKLNLFVLIVTIYKFSTIINIVQPWLSSAHTQKLIRLIKFELETGGIELEFQIINYFFNRKCRTWLNTLYWWALMWLQVGSVVRYYQIKDMLQ